MQIPLSLGRAGTRLVYRIPVWYRAVSGLVVLTLVASAFVSGGLGVIGYTIIGLAVLAALYEERWTLDTESGMFYGRVGLVFWAKGPSMPFSEVARVRIDTFAKGRLDQQILPPDDKMPTGSQARLIVETKTGGSIMVESVPWRQRAELTITAKAMAEAMNVTLEE